MFGLTYEQIIEKIQEEKGLSKEEIGKRIEEKVKDLSDLISKEGAAHILAHELGLKVFHELKKRRFKIKEVIAGLSSVHLLGKIVTSYGIRAYKKEQREGRVASMLLGDETGVIRLVFWDDSLINMIAEGKITEGDILSIKNAYSRVGNGFTELHLGNKAEIEINPEGEEIESIGIKEEVVQPIFSLKEGTMALIQGTIVQVFEPRFYAACSECGRKVVLVLDRYQCQEHGIIKERYLPVFNFFLDDGSDSIRVVCFRENVKKLLGDEVEKFREDASGFDEIRNNLLGKQFKINGRVTKNDFFDHLELRAQDIEEVDALTLAQEIANTFQK